jgi:pimeloyl-ACP methyl ester carboxylesterase
MASEAALRRQIMSACLLAFGAVIGSVLLLSTPARAAEPALFTGTIDGADYRIEVPQQWNGTLLLWSHGTVLPGRANPARDQPADQPATGRYLLNAGYALAGSSFRHTGWAVDVAQRDNIALLDYFASAVGKPKRTIAWGGSMGGLISAHLVQRFPERFDGALPIGGTVAGGAAYWNTRLDSAFVVKTLLPGGSDLPIVNLSDADAAVAHARELLDQAQATTEGRARLALAAAIADVPGWYDPNSAPPATDDYAAQQANQFTWLRAVYLGNNLYTRSDLEQRAGGNVSSNVGVDYRQQLERSIDRDEVYALYDVAGLDLEADLRALAKAPRVQADPGVMTYADGNTTLDGRLTVPVLALHTTGDGNVVVQSEAAYANTVRAGGHSSLLRQLFVNRAGHFTHTSAEEITAFLTLVHRLDTGRWDDDDSPALNVRAAALGPDLNTLSTGVPQPMPVQPAFVDFQPAPFLRPWDARCTTGVSPAPRIGELGPVCL